GNLLRVERKRQGDRLAVPGEGVLQGDEKGGKVLPLVVERELPVDVDAGKAVLFGKGGDFLRQRLALLRRVDALPRCPLPDEGALRVDGAPQRGFALQRFDGVQQLVNPQGALIREGTAGQ